MEIGNTDAEGRLILADALALADEEAPELLFDFATLTGAARVALGPDLPPFYTDDEGLAAEISPARRAPVIRFGACRFGGPTTRCWRARAPSQRYAWFAWSEQSSTALLTEYDANRHWRRTFVIDIDHPQQKPRRFRSLDGRRITKTQAFQSSASLRTGPG